MAQGDNDCSGGLAFTFEVDELSGWFIESMKSRVVR